MSESNRMAFRYLKEVTWGTTPASALKTLRITGESLSTQSQTVESAEIRSDRQLRDLIRTGISGSGDVNFELSYGTLDEFLEAVLCDAWQTDTGLAGAEVGTDLLENGTTESSFTFEKSFEDISEFIAWKGQRLNTLSLNFALNSIITGSFGVMGKKGAAAAATVGTGAPTAATDSVPISIIDVASMSEGGGALTGATAFSIAIANNLRTRMAIGSDEPTAVKYGGFRLTGSLTTYFASRTLYEKFTGHTESSLGVTVTDEDGNAYVFDIPSVRYSGGEIVAGGGDQDILVTMPWTAKYDATSEKTIRITRNPA